TAGATASWRRRSAPPPHRAECQSPSPPERYASSEAATTDAVVLSSPSRRSAIYCTSNVRPSTRATASPWHCSGRGRLWTALKNVPHPERERSEQSKDAHIRDPASWLADERSYGR